MNIIETKILSDLVLNILSAGDLALNLTPNNFCVLKSMIRQSDDPEMAVTAMSEWESFEKFLKAKNLRLNYFALNFVGDKYLFVYEVESKIHSNGPFHVVEVLLNEEISNTPFEMVPSVFAWWLNVILHNIPYPDLLELAEG